jgi:decaprenylphospho-beta-D-ribofuranose 2-oxidase
VESSGAPILELHGWGRHSPSRSFVARPERVRDAVPPPTGPVIPRGLGRSYGDAATLEDGTVLLMERLNRFLAFDEAAGVLTAEAGASIADVIETFVPRGWFPPVTPGTKHVTLGGCVAADVHGKNHHRDGAFGAHVRALLIVLADGSRRRCSPSEEPDLFWATVGGMGLTGIVLEVTLRLVRIESALMRVEHRRAADLDAVLALLADPAWDDETSIAWIDATAREGRIGRGIAMRGHHAARAELSPRVKDPLRWRAGSERALPCGLPSGALRPGLLACFNDFYYAWQGRKERPFLAPADGYFYPLDVLADWNRLYGRQGFTQYQCVLPDRSAEAGIRRILEAIRIARRPSTLAVLKRFGPADPAPLSFPMAGYTLAMDFALADPDVFPLLDGLDEIVAGCGGRVYLAKDARLRPEVFRAMYPRFAEWLRVKRAVDPGDRFQSDLSRRLGMGASA